MSLAVLNMSLSAVRQFPEAMERGMEDLTAGMETAVIPGVEAVLPAVMEMGTTTRIAPTIRSPVQIAIRVTPASRPIPRATADQM
jgi:hypothetical protein